MRHRAPATASALLLGGMAFLLGACGPSSPEPPGERLGQARSASAVPGPWAIPAETLAIGDTQWIEYTGAGPWDDGASCSGGLTPGAAIVRAYLAEHFPQATSIGGYSCRHIVGDPSTMSVHGTGRALDVMIPLDGGEADNGLGDPVGNFVIENAQAIGIQHIIWDLWKWRGDRPAGDKDGPYTGAHPHDDHLHIELSVEASEHTSIWFDDVVNPPGVPGCDPVPPEGSIIDDSSPCFLPYGSGQFWRIEQGVGYGGSLHWTNAFESDSPSNWGRWILSFVEAGSYSVELYLEPGFALADDVRYEVVASGLRDELFVDQSSADGWTLLGTFDFAEGGGQSVDGFDDSPVPVAPGQHIAFDAIRLTRLGLDPPDGGPVDPGGGGAGAGSSAAGAGPAPGGPAAGVPGAGSDGSCTMPRRAPHAPAGLPLWAALLAVAWLVTAIGIRRLAAALAS